MEYMIHINRIKCEGCVQAISDALSKVQGLKDYRIDVTNKSVFVSTGTTTIEAVAKALRDAGYPPENITP